MNIQEAIVAGDFIYRSGWDFSVIIKNDGFYNAITDRPFHLTREDVLAADWHVSRESEEG